MVGIPTKWVRASQPVGKRRNEMEPTMSAPADRMLEAAELEQVTGGRMVIPGNHTVEILALQYGLPPPPPGNPTGTLLLLGQLGVFGPF
jgi:hypothetical protein